MSGCPSSDWRKAHEYLLWLKIDHHIFSTCRPPSHPLSIKNPRSDHIRGLALDTDWRDVIWDAFEPLALGKDRVVKQLIKSPQGSITNGVQTGQIAGHYDHTHVAVIPGSIWPHERAGKRFMTRWFPPRKDDNEMQARLAPGEEWVFPLFLGRGDPDNDKQQNTFRAWLKASALLEDGKAHPAVVHWVAKTAEGLHIRGSEDGSGLAAPLVIDTTKDAGWASTPQADVFHYAGSPAGLAGSVRVRNDGPATVIVTLVTYEGIVSSS